MSQKWSCTPRGQECLLFSCTLHLTHCLVHCSSLTLVLEYVPNAEWRGIVIHARSVALYNISWERFGSFLTLRSCPPFSKLSLCECACLCAHTQKYTHMGFSFTRDSACTKLSMKESPESHIELWIIRSDSVQKPHFTSLRQLTATRI